MEEISLKFNISEGAIKIACDGLNVIRKYMYSATRYSCLSYHFDLILATDHNILKSPLTYFWRHVKGPQDDQTGLLDRRATFNVECKTEKR